MCRFKKCLDAPESNFALNVLDDIFVCLVEATGEYLWSNKILFNLFIARQIVFKLKKDKIEPPEINLGARLELKNLNGKKMWTMCSRDYIKLAVENIESRLKNMGMKLPSKQQHQWLLTMPQNWTEHLN